jgi:hypothetical protein
VERVRQSHPVGLCASLRADSSPLPIRKADLDRISGRLVAALLEAAACGEMDFSPEAALLWDALYPELTEDHGGAFGAVTSRAEAQVRRLALLHAVMDEDASAIGVAHLRAAIALWQYCRVSARYIFGNVKSDPDATKLLAALDKREMTLTDINGLFSGHKSKNVLTALLARLQAVGRVTLREEGGGPQGRAKTIVSLRK